MNPAIPLIERRLEELDAAENQIVEERRALHAALSAIRRNDNDTRPRPRPIPDNPQA